MQRVNSRVRFAPHELWRGVHETVRNDSFGGALLAAATVGALVLANSPATGWFNALRDLSFGPAALHLDLSLRQWVSDGLLAVFFFVVGLELKEEFVVGRLRNPRQAALPIAAAFGGVLVPALIFVLVNASGGAGALRGWAIPTATDIAFAVAVLAMAARWLSPALRVFLLTLAIVDDLIGITIIAVGYASGIHLGWLAAALVPLGLFAFAVQRGVRTWWLLVPLAAATWLGVHSSGIHATIAGVLLGFVVPVVASERARVQVGTDADGTAVYDGLAAHFADRWGVVSTLVVLPVFAFFSAGVTIGGYEGLRTALGDPVTLGIVAGLVLGKPVGILGTTYLLSRHREFRLDETLRWPELVGMAFVAGIGFTVSLLIGELAFNGEVVAEEHVTIGVLLGSLVAGTIGALILAPQNRRAKGLSSAV